MFDLYFWPILFSAIFAIVVYCVWLVFFHREEETFSFSVGPAVGGITQLVAPALAFSSSLAVQILPGPLVPLAFSDRLLLGDADLPACELCDQLATAELAFNGPRELRLGQEDTIELILAPETTDAAARDGLSEGLTGDVQTATAQFALRTRATLRGPAFEIDPAGPQERTVLPDRPTSWTWTIKPTEPGENKSLTLIVESVLVQGDAQLPPVEIETFRQDIHVSVSLLQKAWIWITEANTLAIAVTGVGTLAVAVLTWLWSRRPWKKEEEDTYNPGFPRKPKDDR